MELTQQCIEEIMLAAREAASGKLVITLESRPEDSRNFDLKCEYVKRFRVSSQAIPTVNAAKRHPQDKFS
jgi:hypothetical protein